ncbi:MAG: recombination protein NinG [Bacteroidales bacterium]
MPRRPLQPYCSARCERQAREERTEAKMAHTTIQGTKCGKSQHSQPDSYTKRVNFAKVVFQAWVRRRDKGLPCPCCGDTQGFHDGGHFKKAEIYRGVLFHEMNVNGCCTVCNRHMDGNIAAYRIGLIEKYGEQAVDELEQFANETRNKVWSDEELNAIIKKYK